MKLAEAHTIAAEIIERWGLWNQGLLHTAPAFKKALQLDLGLKIDSPVAGLVTALQPSLMLQND